MHPFSPTPAPFHVRKSTCFLWAGNFSQIEAASFLLVDLGLVNSMWTWLPNSAENKQKYTFPAFSRQGELPFFLNTIQMNAEWPTQSQHIVVDFYHHETGGNCHQVNFCPLSVYYTTAFLRAFSPDIWEYKGYPNS